jgi:hypothetical protein
MKCESKGEQSFRQRHIHTYTRAYASNMRDLRLSEPVHTMRSSEAISLVDIALAFDISETVCVSTIRGDVMSDVF